MNGLVLKVIAIIFAANCDINVTTMNTATVCILVLSTTLRDVIEECTMTSGTRLIASSPIFQAVNLFLHQKLYRLDDVRKVKFLYVQNDV